MQDTILNNLFRAMRYSVILTMTLICTITFGSFGMTLVQKAYATNIKNLVVVSDSVLRASDIFDDLPADANKVLGAAPHPGQDMVLNARTLLRIALALNISWRPTSNTEQVVIRRAATLVPVETIEAALTQQIAEKGVTDKFNLVFNAPIGTMTLPESEAASVEVNQFEYDATEGRFKAEIVAPSKDRPLLRKMVHGKIERLLSIPVLNKPVQAGTLISGHDVQWIELPAYQIQHDIVLSADEMVGMTPRRMVMAGEPLRHQQIAEPLLVERGDLITLNYNEGPIYLSAEAKALQGGANGDVIRVVNLSSNRTLDAIVTGSRTVAVK